MQEEISLKRSLMRLRDNGFRPGTIFDVGVATGTTGLYSVFNDARYALIDPLAESEPFMSSICAKFSGSVYELAAAGAADGIASFVVEPGLSGSSFFLKGEAASTRNVQVKTLDGIIEKHNLLGPFLLKLDVQGAEIDVMRGLVKHIDKAEIVVAETSLWADRKARNAATTAAIFEYFSSRGFVLYDIAGIAYRPRDGAMAETDLVFCRATSALRENASYRTPEQRAERSRAKAAKFKNAQPRL